MADVVVDLLDRRPMWRPPDWALERITTSFPDRDVHVLDEAADGTGDGRKQPSAELLAAVRAAAVYIGYGVPGAVLEAGPALRWVHTGAAGVKGSLTATMRARDDVVFTNSAGVHAPPMAESVLGMILYFARGFDLALDAQRQAEWRKAPFETADCPVREVQGSTVGIVGYGGVGREVARRVRALGARVLALKRRTGRPEPDVELLYGRDGLRTLLAASDYVVLSLPETDETRRIIDAAALEHIRPGAVLVNVGRGAIVDEPALVEALRAGRLRGAGLDVFEREPLPPESPLWALPNVLITPHVSATSPAFWRRETELIRENAERLAAGRPLLNVVDKRAGY